MNTAAADERRRIVAKGFRDKTQGNHGGEIKHDAHGAGEKPDTIGLDKIFHDPAG